MTKLWGPQDHWKWTRDARSEDGQMVSGKSCSDTCQSVVAGHWQTLCKRAGSVCGVIVTAPLADTGPQSWFMYRGLPLPTDSFFTISTYCQSQKWALVWPKQWMWKALGKDCAWCADAHLDPSPECCIHCGFSHRITEQEKGCGSRTGYGAGKHISQPHNPVPNTVWCCWGSLCRKLNHKPHIMGQHR